MWNTVLFVQDVMNKVTIFGFGDCWGYVMEIGLEGRKGFKPYWA